MFIDVQRLDYFYHYKNDLINEAKILGLLNKKNKNNNINITLDVIKRLSLFPIEYKGNLKYIDDQISDLLNKYPMMYNYIISYFKKNKYKYIEDGSFNYANFPPDIRNTLLKKLYNYFL